MNVELQSVYSFHRIGGRDNQEDSRYPDQDAPSTDQGVFVVCDGVGGNAKGEVASSTVCQAIETATKGHKSSDAFSERDFQRVLTAAYDAMDRASNASNRGMGTTLTLVAFSPEGALAAHIGDSRIYQIRQGEGIIYRSEDHSLVNALLRSGNISPDQVKGHPKSHVITRCMSAANGERERDDATLALLTDIQAGDYFLLCSDGVTGMIDDDELVDMLSGDAADADKMARIADGCQQSADNNTAILIHIGTVTGTKADSQRSEDSAEGAIRPTGTRDLRHRQVSVHDVSSNKTCKSKIKQFLEKLFK